MMVTTYLQAGVCMFSILAAALWVRSATVRIPNIMENTTWAGMGAFPDALKAQAKWNSAAAWSAAVAALLQSLVFALGRLG